MKCPNCNISLLMAQRDNVEVDYCPECRGVWLDRGELDKIIERSSTISTHNGVKKGHADVQGYPIDAQYPYRKKSRGSFFGDLFDF